MHLNTESGWHSKGSRDATRSRCLAHFYGLDAPASRCSLSEPQPPPEHLLHLVLEVEHTPQETILRMLNEDTVSCWCAILALQTCRPFQSCHNTRFSPVSQLMMLNS